MLFNSYQFLFVFWPISLLFYRFLFRFGPAVRNCTLLISSLTFYSYWDFRFTPLLVSSLLINYFAGHCIAAALKSRIGFMATILLALTVALNLAVLGVF